MHPARLAAKIQGQIERFSGKVSPEPGLTASDALDIVKYSLGVPSGWRVQQARRPMKEATDVLLCSLPPDCVQDG